MPLNAPSSLSRLTRLAFYVWTAVGFLVVPLNLNEERLRSAITLWWITDPASRILSSADAVWLWLGACTTFIALGSEVSWRKACLCALGIGGTATLVEIAGVMTGIPFGEYVYSARLGPKLFSILPVTIPAAWFIVVVNGHAVAPASRWRPFWVGLIAVGTDVSLEIVAWKIRGYWDWYPGRVSKPNWPPWQNYASWFILGAALDWLFLRRLPVRRLGTSSLGILLAMNLLFWVTILCSQPLKLTRTQGRAAGSRYPVHLFLRLTMDLERDGRAEREDPGFYVDDPIAADDLFCLDRRPVSHFGFAARKPDARATRGWVKTVQRNQRPGFRQLLIELHHPGHLFGGRGKSCSSPLRR